MNFSGKTFFITGSANGIGKHLTHIIVEKGGFVHATDIQNEKLLELYKDEPLIKTHAFNVSKESEWEAILEACFKKSSIDYLLNVAGVIKPGYIHEQPIKDIDFQIDVNLKGTMYGCHHYSKMLVEKNLKGHIINVASMAGVAPVSGINAYTASKFGVRGFTLAIRQELKPYGIDVSVVCPDAVDTAMYDLQKDYKEAAMTFSMSKPLTVEDIGKAILNDVIKKKKAEVRIPFDRGLLAAFGGNFPEMADLLYGVISQKGIKNQEKFHK